MAYHEEGVLNGGFVAHRGHVVLLELEDHHLFEELVAHQELLGGTRDVPVVVHDAQSCEVCQELVHPDCSKDMPEGWYCEDCWDSVYG